MDNTMKKRKFDPYPKVFIPDEVLPIPVEDMVEGLKKKGFHDGVRWVGWKEEMSKKDLPAYFNKLANAVDQIIEERKNLSRTGFLAVNDVGVSQSQTPGHAPPQRRLRWAYVALNKRYPGEPSVGGRDPPKPEIVLVTNDDRISIKWTSIHAFCGFELDMPTLPSISLIFEEQENRRFIMECALKDDMITLARTDYSGSLECGPYNIHENVEDFIRIVVGLTLLDPQHLGYDTTLSIAKGTGEVMLGEGTACKVFRAVHHRGEGSKCFEVEHPENRETTCLMKDVWVGEDQDAEEVVTLRKFNELGITNVPKVVASEIVRIDGHIDSTGNFRSAVCIAGDEIRAKQREQDEQDSASDRNDDADIAAGYVEEEASDGLVSGASIPSKTSTDAEDSRKSEPQPFRDHHRILLEPAGQKLEEFRCLEEFILAVKDIVSGSYRQNAIELLADFGFAHNM